MRLLLDTDIALWAVADDERLPPRARGLISDQANDVFVSAASVWEIAIKHALARGGPNDMPVSGAEALRYFLDAGYELVGISPADAAAVETLPMLHADPFDRLLIAQALSVPFRLLTHDPRVARCNPSIILV
jgi:PIN domain nuclease of toxin-antitoxin system